MAQRKAPIRSYWEIIEPLFKSVDFGSEPETFAKSTAAMPRSALLVFSSHMCLAEMHNGGLLQLFWNTTGILVPEGIEGFKVIEMPTLAALLGDVATSLGSPYPRHRNDRWDAMLCASGYGSRHLKAIFKKHANLFLAFQQATEKQFPKSTNEEIWKCAENENGGSRESRHWVRAKHSVCSIAVRPYPGTRQ